MIFFFCHGAIALVSSKVFASSSFPIATLSPFYHCAGISLRIFFHQQRLSPSNSNMNLKAVLEHAAGQQSLAIIQKSLKNSKRRIGSGAKNNDIVDVDSYTEETRKLAQASADRAAVREQNGVQAAQKTLLKALSTPERFM